VEDDERNGHARSHRTDENIVKVRNVVHSVSRLSINQAYYVEISKRLRETVHIKRPELWPNVWILHHDSAPAHKELCVKQFLAKKSFLEMEHPPSSPDLAPNGLWLFTEIKSALMGRRFQDIKNSPPPPK
jgi:histone-lysine N-methyltransferase SETMAR